MCPGIIVLEDNLVVSLFVLWPFFLQCSAQTHHLRSIPIPCDGSTQFQQLIIHHTEMVPPNAEHNFGTVNIRSGRRCGGMSGNSPWFPALEIIAVDPFFVASHNWMQKPISILSLKQLFPSKETPFKISRLQLVRNPIPLLLNHSHGFETFQNGLLSHSQWFCQFFLRLARVFSK